MKLLAERFDLHTGLPKGDPYFGTSLKSKGAAAAIPEIRVHHAAPQTVSSRSSPKEQSSSSLAISRNRRRGRKWSATPHVRPLPRHFCIATPQFSVSAIEQADAVLHGARAPWPISADPLDEEELRDSDDPTVLGTLVHSVIDRLPWSVRDEGRRSSGRPDAAAITGIVNAALRGLSATDAGNISVEAVVRRVQAFVESDLWSELAGAQRWFREIDFLLCRGPLSSACGDEQAIISGQIDCLVQTGDERLEDHRLQNGPHSRRRSGRPV